jgi:hypothetical protein
MRDAADLLAYAKSACTESGAGFRCLHNAGSTCIITRHRMRHREANLCTQDLSYRYRSGLPRLKFGAKSAFWQGKLKDNPSTLQ